MNKTTVHDKSFDANGGGAGAFSLSAFCCLIALAHIKTAQALKPSMQDRIVQYRALASNECTDISAITPLRVR